MAAKFRKDSTRRRWRHPSQFFGRARYRLPPEARRGEGWRRTQSQSNLSQQQNSLLTAKITGNFADSGLNPQFWWRVSWRIQSLKAKFPAKRNRELNSENRELQLPKSKVLSVQQVRLDSRHRWSLLQRSPRTVKPLEDHSSGDGRNLDNLSRTPRGGSEPGGCAPIFRNLSSREWFIILGVIQESAMSEPIDLSAVPSRFLNPKIFLR
jgi:hypothetical protein